LECDYEAIKDSRLAEIYAHHFESISKMQRSAEVACPEGESLATCDECKCACWVRDDVALLQRVGFRSADLDWKGPFGWRLEQTGGMCAALVFTTDAREIVVTAMDGMFLVGEYERVSGDESSWDDCLRAWESAPFFRDEDEPLTPDEMESLVAECARQVLEFVRHPTPTDADREAHQAAAGAKCHEGPDGMCLTCGVEMTLCNVCKGIGYHREGCAWEAVAEGNGL
jgi:hypothetical protein